MTEWFRTWHGAATDKKWRVIAKRVVGYQASPAHVVAVAWAMLDHASQAQERGSVADFDIAAHADYLDLLEEQVAAIVKAIGDYRSPQGDPIVSDGRFAKWERRQPNREDSSAERTRAYRARLKQQEPEKVTAPEPEPLKVNWDAVYSETVTLNGDDVTIDLSPSIVTDIDVTQRDADVTPRTEKRRTEKKRGEENKKKEHVSSPVKPRAREEPQPLAEPKPHVLSLEEVAAQARGNLPDADHLPPDWAKLSQDLFTAFEDCGVPAVQTHCLYKWKEFGWLPEIIKSTVLDSLNTDRGREGKIRSLLWFERKLQEIHDQMRAEKLKPALDAQKQEQNWGERISRYKRNPSLWVIAYGPRPGEPNCRAPPEVLKKFGFEVSAIGQAAEPVQAG